MRAPVKERAKLSLLITALQPRVALAIDLLKRVVSQAAVEGGVEVLMALDDFGCPLAEKRNRLLDMACGRYVAFIDDDDRVSNDYVHKIIGAIDANPDVDCISFEGWRTDDHNVQTNRMNWSLATQFGYDDGTTRFRPVNHLCPIRRDIAVQSWFPANLPYGSDQPYWRLLLAADLLKTEVHLPDALYYYRFRSEGTATQTGKMRRASREQEWAFRFYRLRETTDDCRAGMLLRHIGDRSGARTRVIDRDGRGHTFKTDALEEIGPVLTNIGPPIGRIDLEPFVVAVEPEIVKNKRGEYGPTANDLRAMLALQNRFQPERCLEIGVHDGHTAALMLAECPWIKEYVGLDVTRNPTSGNIVPAVVGELARDDERFGAVSSPHGTKDLGETELVGPFDWIFIDAGHNYDQVAFDTTWAAARVRPGGLLVWHDFGVASQFKPDGPIFGVKQYLLERSAVMGGVVTFLDPKKTSSIAFQLQP